MNESADDISHEFDYHADFTQFLEEARKNLDKVKSNAMTNKEKQSDWEKGNWKSWKSYIFSWLKNDKKRKSLKQPSNSTTLAPKARRDHVSGLVELARASTVKAQRTYSAPLTRLFGSTRRCEVPYICLGQLNKQEIQSYGPVYLVT